MSVGLLPVAAAFATGLIGTPHCAGMCGPLCATARDAPSMAAWHFGRIGAYATLGALGATLGGLPSGGRVAALGAAVLIVYSAAVIAGVVQPLHVAIPGVSTLGRRLVGDPSLLAKAAFGALAALLPCGLLWAAFAGATALGDARLGAASMIAFGLGTTPGPLAAALGARRLAMAGPWARRGVATLVLASGLWVVWSRAASPPDECPMHANQ